MSDPCEKEYEPACERGGQQNPHRGQHDSFLHDRLYGAELRLETAAVKDDAEGNRADELCDVEIVERQAEAVHTERHSHDYEQEKDGNTEAVAGPADEYRCENQYGTYKEYVLRRKL